LLPVRDIRNYTKGIVGGSIEKKCLFPAKHLKDRPSVTEKDSNWIPQEYKVELAVITK
jgi:hypothetical protein